MRHLYRCPLRWADIDLLGHVNNVTYVDYLQEARVDVFRTHAPDARSEDLAEGVVVVRHELTYISSLELGSDPVSIECWVTDIGAASFSMDYEIFEEDREGVRTVFLRARTLLAPYVFATGRPRRLRDAERESLSRLLEPAARVRPPLTPEVVDVPGGLYLVPVRFSDLDVYGHVNNVKYLEYFQEARLRLVEANGRPVGEGDYHLVVAQSDVDYKRPILYRPEPYECRTWVSRVGNTSLSFESVIRDGDAVLARATVTSVCMNSTTGRPVPVPDELRRLSPPAC